MKLFLQMQVFDTDKGLIKDTGLVQSKSFLKAFIAYLYARAYPSSQSSPTTTLDTGGSSRSIYLQAGYSGIFYNSIGGSCGQLTLSGNEFRGTSSNYGVVVGTGTDAITSTDYKLKTIIAYGVGAGQLEDCGTIPGAVTVSAPNASFTISKIFRNGSGGSITINEAGLYGVGIYGGYVLCTVRDLVSPGVAIADGNYLKVTYTIQITA